LLSFYLKVSVDQFSYNLHNRQSSIANRQGGGDLLDNQEKSGYILPRMKYQIVIAKSAQEAFKKLDARWRSSLKEAMRTHLENTPKQESKSRIKRLKGLRQPQYRLRVDRLRVFYDVNDEKGRVEVLGFVMKPEAENWLKEHGVPE
jgi:mRNA-degrading endonuclease RelE of RelBE toxin-antitoxin system